MVEQRNLLSKIDKPILMLFLALVLIGWANIFAATITDGHESIFDISQNYGKQAFFIGLSLVVGGAILLFDARFFSSFSWVIYLFFIFILVFTIFFGTEINASKSWFRIGDFAIQPAEFAKYSTALALAKFISSINANKIDTPIIFKAALIFGIPAILILLQNDTGTALVFSAFILIFYREGFIKWWLVAIVLGAVVLFILTLLFNEFIIIGVMSLLAAIFMAASRKLKSAWKLVLVVFIGLSAYVYSLDYIYENVLQPHQKLRIEVLLDEKIDLRGAGYNLHQSKIAIGSGGLLGKGYLKGTQTRLDFVPEQGTDFIFCTIGEEWGFAGGLILLLLFMGLILRIVLLAERQRSVFTRVYGYSIASILFFHFFVNIGMTIGLVPVIGIPLPLISSGGSSLLAFSIMIFTFLKLDSQKMDVL
jgi:rod shape determining protein RodA